MTPTIEELQVKLRTEAAKAFWESVPGLPRMLLEAEAAGKTKDVQRIEAFLRRTYAKMVDRDRERFRSHRGRPGGRADRATQTIMSEDATTRRCEVPECPSTAGYGLRVCDQHFGSRQPRRTMRRRSPIYGTGSPGTTGTGSTRTGRTPSSCTGLTTLRRSGSCSRQARRRGPADIGREAVSEAPQAALSPSPPASTETQLPKSVGASHAG
jgi:hypothetical protein